MAGDRGVLPGLAVCRRAPRINHMFFADDSLLFGRANIQEAQALGNILHDYEIASGQKVNMDKSAVCFSPNTPPVSKGAFLSVLGFAEVNDLGKYLGLPSVVGRSKRAIFSGVKDRMWQCLHNWQGSLLSNAGKEILIKAVFQAIPSYDMSCFKMPEGMIHEIAALCARFVWGSKAGKRKIHWLKWEDLCKPKKSGGLGFRDFSCFNDAMLAKQCWRLIKNPDSLAGRVLRANSSSFSKLR